MTWTHVDIRRGCVTRGAMVGPALGGRGGSARGSAAGPAIVIAIIEFTVLFKDPLEIGSPAAVGLPIRAGMPPHEDEKEDAAIARIDRESAAADDWIQMRAKASRRHK